MRFKRLLSRIRASADKLAVCDPFSALESIYGAFGIWHLEFWSRREADKDADIDIDIDKDIDIDIDAKNTDKR